MGRRRSSNKHLPRGMVLNHGAYYFKAAGKWHMLSRDYGEALRKYADLVGKKRGITTIEQAMSHCLALWQNKLKQDTIIGYTRSAKRLIPVFGKLAPDELRRDHIYKYLTERGDVAANRDRAFLSGVYTHLLNAGVFVGVNPCIGLEYRNPERARTRYITDGELAALINGLPRKLGLMAQWSYLTGMRESEMLALRLTAASDTGVTYTPLKARKGREKEPVLIEWTNELRTVWKAAAGDRIGAQPLFPTRDGEHYSRDSFQSTWQRWRKKIAIPDLRWHDIRRKTGSDSESAAAAAERLVHADEAVTKKHYRAKPKVIRPLK